MWCFFVQFNKDRMKSFVKYRHIDMHSYNRNRQTDIQRSMTDKLRQNIQKTQSQKEANKGRDKFTKQPSGRNRFRLLQQKDIGWKTQETWSRNSIWSCSRLNYFKGNWFYFFHWCGTYALYNLCNQKVLQVINTSCNVAGYKINRKYIAFLYKNDKYREKDIRERGPSTIVSKINILGNVNQSCERLV